MSNNASNDPPQPEVSKLVALYNSRDFLGAERFCKQLLSSYSSSATVSNMLGMIYMAQGKMPEAEAAYQNTIQTNPGFPDVYNNLGILLHSMGRIEECIEKFNKAVELDAEFADARNNLGAMLQNVNQHEQALIHLAKAISLNPNNGLAYFNYANSLKAMAKNEEALDNYNKAVKLIPSFPVAFNNRGNLLETMGRLEEAQRSYSRAIDLDRNYTSAHSNRGIVERKLGNYPGALRDFTKAVQLDPWQPDNPNQDVNFKFRLYINLGDIQMYFQKFEKALEAYDFAAKIEPDSSDVKAFKGNAVAALGNLEEGLKLRQESFGFVSFNLDKGVSIHHG